MVAINKNPLAESQIAWLAGAAVVGFAASALFAGSLQLSRTTFLLPYGIVVTLFVCAYFRWSSVELARHFRDRPLLGVLGAVVAGTLVVWNVLTQPASAAPEGWPLVSAILWVGVVYGVLDALLLSVMPVIAVWIAFGGRASRAKPNSELLVAALALGASLLVTAAYHAGYPEFRGPQIAGPVIGNAILTAAYLLTRSPVSTTLGHVAMHVAAVLHGVETTSQLPPHY